MINNGGGAENIGFLSKQVDLATVLGQDEETVRMEHMNLAGMYILNGFVLLRACQWSVQDSKT